MGGKASGALALVEGLLGLLLIVAAIRGTYVSVWQAVSKGKFGANANALTSGGGNFLGLQGSGGGGSHATSH